MWLPPFHKYNRRRAVVVLSGLGIDLTAARKELEQLRGHISHVEAHGADLGGGEPTLQYGNQG